MKIIIFNIYLVTVMLLPAVHMVAIETDNGETSLHFDFKTENGQERMEVVKYINKPQSKVDLESGLQEEIITKPIEFRGGYSFISADGYEYTVKYKANKNGFQPYVTARKLISSSNEVFP